MRVAVLALLPLPLLGCTSDRPRPGASVDGGGALEDAGPGADGGSTDAGAADAGADAGPMCPDDPVVPYTTRPCGAETKACVDACDDPACVDSCLASDPSSACTDCVNRAIIACFNRNGCQPMWNCYRACVRENCTMAVDLPACLDMHCAETEQAFYDCVDAIFETSPCAMRYVDCLPE